MSAGREPGLTGPRSVPGHALRRVLASGWGLEGSLRRLYGERDLNFRLDRTTGRPLLVKVAHPDTPPDRLDVQDRAMAQVRERDPALPIPRPVLDRAGSTRRSLPGGGGELRVFTWLDGRPLDADTADEAAARALGAVLARLSLALQDCNPSGAPGDLPWDLCRFPSLAPLRHALPDPDLRGPVDRALLRHRQRLAPALNALPRQLIHNDLNPDNLLLDPQHPGRVTGVIDFGDLVEAPVVCDLAVALAYLVNAEAEQPFTRLAAAVDAFHRVRPLDAEERNLLPGLVASRLATTVLIQSARVGGGQDQDGSLGRTVAVAAARLGRLEEKGLGRLREALRRAT